MLIFYLKKQYLSLKNSYAVFILLQGTSINFKC